MKDRGKIIANILTRTDDIICYIHHVSRIQDGENPYLNVLSCFSRIVEFTSVMFFLSRVISLTLVDCDSVYVTNNYQQLRILYQVDFKILMIFTSLWIFTDNEKVSLSYRNSRHVALVPVSVRVTFVYRGNYCKRSATSL